MSAISRKSPTPLRSCCKMSSEQTRVPAAWYMASPVFRSAPRSSWKSSSRSRGTGADDARFHRSVAIAGPGPRKGTSRGTPDLLSNNADRWSLHLLQRGRTERRADDAAPPRTPLFIADVRASLRPPVRSLSPGRARLPRLRTQRLAGPESIRLHVRPLRRDHESLRRSTRALALHAVYAGLRRPRGVSHGVSPSGADRGAHRPGRGGAQRRLGGELEGAAGLLGRSRR